MDLTKFDKNFDLSFQSPEDVEWFSIRQNPFKLYGIFYSDKEGLYRRLPKEIADKTSEGVSYLSKHTAGGRVRFTTDSPYTIFNEKSKIFNKNIIDKRFTILKTLKKM